MNTHDIDIELPDVPFIFQYGQYNEDDLRQPDCRLIPYRDFQEIMRAYARAAIEADRKRRGEPKDRRDIRGIVKKLQSAYVKDGSTDEWVRLRRHVLEEAIDTLRLVSADCAHFYESYKAACERATQPAEPVKVPSEADLLALIREHAFRQYEFDDLLAFARALLARYGRPADWQGFTK